MSPEHKQRIVGVAVLAAFVILLIPFLFTSGIRKKLSNTDEMPISVQKRQLITKQIQGIKSNNSESVETAVPAPVLTPTQQPTMDETLATTLPQDPLEQPSDMLLPLENSTASVSIADVPMDAPQIANTTAQPIVSVKTKVKTVDKKVNVAKKIKNSKEFWSVQIGSFSNQVLVQQLINKLHAHGFHVYMQKINTATKILTRVLVGHEASRENASKIATRLETALKIKGNLVRNKK